ncbi:MAG: hypothetical protein RR640_06740, partial [Oscillospiraceae bacterium]
SASKIYFKTVLITSIFCFLAFLIIWGFLYTKASNEKKTKGELTVPISNSEKDNSKINFLIFLKSAYTNEYLETVLVNLNFAANKINMVAFSSSCQIEDKDLKYYYNLDGASACAKKISEHFKINTFKYFDFSADQLYLLTKKFGNVTFNVDEIISYYDKKTGNSFLASAGYNKLTGSDCVKMIEYYLSGSYEPNPKKADEIACELTRAYFLTSIKGSSFLKDDFIFILNNSKTNVTAFDYEGVKKKISLFLKSDFKIDFIKNDGIYSSMGAFTPSGDFKNSIIKEFS